MQLFFTLLPFIIISYIIADICFLVPFEQFLYGVYVLLCGSCFIVTLFACFSIAFDFLFGFTFKSIAKNATDVSEVQVLSFLQDIFNELKDKFGIKKATLFIEKNKDVNAYAFGGMKSNKVILTMGLLELMRKQYDDDYDYKMSLAGVIAHELSHISNMDFLPGLFLRSVNNTVNFISRSIYDTIVMLLFTISFIPLFGKPVRSFTLWLYIKIDKALKFLQKSIVFKADYFIRMILSRTTEHRSDANAALATGGESLVLVFKALDIENSSMDNLFSSHPSIKSRIKRVSNIQMSQDPINPDFLTEFANIWSICVLFILVIGFGYESHINKLPELLAIINSWSVTVIENIKQSFKAGFEFLTSLQALYIKLKTIFG